MSTTAWAILLIVNIPVFWLLGWVVFREWDEFVECVRFWITPEIVSAFQGEYYDSFWGKMRLGLWAILCVASIGGEYYLLMKYFLHR